MNERLPLSGLSVTTHIPSSFFGVLSTVTQGEQHQRLDDARFFSSLFFGSLITGVLEPRGNAVEFPRKLKEFKLKKKDFLERILQHVSS